MKVHYQANKILRLVSTMNQMNLIETPNPIFLRHI
jgi:hypothetical protein